MLNSVPRQAAPETPANDNGLLFDWKVTPPEYDEYSCPPSAEDRIKSRHAAGREGQAS